MKIIHLLARLPSKKKTPSLLKVLHKNIEKMNICHIVTATKNNKGANEREKNNMRFE